MEAADECGVESHGGIGTGFRDLAKNDESGAGEPSLYVNDALYERLMALDSLWKHPGEPPARELAEACERLIKREARLLDDGEFERWIEAFQPRMHLLDTAWARQRSPARGDGRVP